MTTPPKRNCLYLLCMFFMWRTFIPRRQTYLQLAPSGVHTLEFHTCRSCAKFEKYFLLQHGTYSKRLWISFLRSSREDDLPLRTTDLFIICLYSPWSDRACHSHGQFINIRYLLLKIICAYSRISFPWRAPREAQTPFIDVTELFHVSYNGID